MFSVRRGKWDQIGVCDVAHGVVFMRPKRVGAAGRETARLGRRVLQNPGVGRERNRVFIVADVMRFRIWDPADLGRQCAEVTDGRVTSRVVENLRRGILVRNDGFFEREPRSKGGSGWDTGQMLAVALCCRNV